MKQKINLLLLLIAFSSTFAQEKYTISGYVDDKDTGEKLLAATVFDINKNIGATSNNYGFYSLTLSKGEVNLYSSFVGYQ